MPRLFRRVRFIPQMEAAECGAACLAMVLDYHGASVPLSEVRVRCGAGRDGVSAAHIYQAAIGFGLDVRALRVQPAELIGHSLPVILHWEFNHFVVLERIGRKSATIIDPAYGRRKLSPRAFSSAFTGVVLGFEPKSGLEKRRPRSPSLRRYGELLGSLRAGWLSVLVCALLLEVLGLGFPAANQVLIDHVIVPRRAEWMWPLVFVLALTTFGFLALVAVRDRVVRRLHFALDLSLMSNFARHLLRLPLSFFQERSTGDLLQRVAAHGELREAALGALTGALDGLLALSYAALMLAYDVETSAILLGLAAVRVASIFAVRPRVVELSTTQLAEHGKELSALVEPLAAPELVRAFGAERVVADRYQSRLVSRLNAEVQRETVHQRTYEVGGWLGGLSHALAVALGGHAVLEERISIGVFATLITLQGLLIRPLESALTALSVAARVRGALARIDDVLETPAQQSGDRELCDVRGEITLENVSFRYDSRGPLLCNRINLCVRPGEKLSIVGRVGQGKTTLLRLMSGLLTPTEGRVLVDGVALTELSPAALRRHMGVVLQDPFLFDDSVRANLSVSFVDASETELRRATEIACIEDVIDALPEGLDSVLGENGGRLSGGEKQRLGLARALVGAPAILILDEATSSLDLDLERRVHDNLRAVGCTRVLVAHRMETVKDADRIVVIEQGSIVEEGSYSALRHGGLFAALLGSDGRAHA